MIAIGSNAGESVGDGDPSMSTAVSQAGDMMVVTSQL